MFRYSQPTSKAQTFAIAQAYMAHLLKTHSLQSTAPQPRAVFVEPKPNWPARAIMRARRWRSPTINEPAIILGTLMAAVTGAVLHATAFV